MRQRERERERDRQTDRDRENERERELFDKKKAPTTELASGEPKTYDGWAKSSKNFKRAHLSIWLRTFERECILVYSQEYYIKTERI